MVLIINLHMALLWSDPFFAAGGAPDIVLTIAFASTQALLVCAFFVVKAKMLCKTLSALLQVLARRRRVGLWLKPGSLAVRDPRPSPTNGDLTRCDPRRHSLATAYHHRCSSPRRDLPWFMVSTCEHTTHNAACAPFQVLRTTETPHPLQRQWQSQRAAPRGDESWPP